ncbi:uncharacterized protein LOC131851317 [Achroia grisella]|uniref:uncharacterized protein LOC131851317 n=1 Tax=Achroia grisella TaxID=688607 RepID=UPI0027D2E7A3|nr:uncharacterized protein LOC131851317 [Achroia grisella]
MTITKKHERALFCFKICPLYCSPRRYDEDAASTIYIDDDVPYHSYQPYIEDDHYINRHPYHHGHYVWCVPKPTTTTPKPTTTTMATTTQEPSGLCIMCMKKCSYRK